jgi:hypothetical protein
MLNIPIETITWTTKPKAKLSEIKAIAKLIRAGVTK